MVNIFERNGVVILESTDYDLKIDNNRIIYYKTKSDSSSSFRSTGHTVEVGLSTDEKKKYLYNLFVGIEKKKKDTLAEKEAKT